MICGLLVVVSSFKRTEDSTSKSSGIPYVRATSRSLFSSYVSEGMKEEKGREVTDMNYSSLAEQWTVLAQYGELRPTYWVTLYDSQACYFFRERCSFMGDNSERMKEWCKL